jgi:hypothetical protein
MLTVLVTVHGPQKIADLEMPGDTPLGELFPLLLDVCAPQWAGDDPQLLGQWGLGPVGGTPFPPTRTLIDCRVMDGALLLFQDAASWSRQLQALAPVTLVPPGGAASSAQTGGIGIRWNKEGLLS